MRFLGWGGLSGGMDAKMEIGDLGEKSFKTTKDLNKAICSFCSKGRDKVKKMIVGNDDVFICNECVELCCEVLAEKLNDFGWKKK